MKVDPFAPQLLNAVSALIEAAEDEGEDPLALTVDDVHQTCRPALLN